MINVNYYNERTGFTTEIKTEENTTVLSFIQSQTPSFDGSRFDIRVNRNVVPQDYILNDGDKVICIAKNIKGA